MGMLQISDLPAEYLNTVDLYLWIAAIVVQFFAFMIFIKRGFKVVDLGTLRGLLLSYGLFFLFMGINRIFFILAYKTNFYSESLGIGYVFASSGAVPVIYILEKYMVRKTKMMFTILTIITTAVCISPLVFPERLIELRELAQILALFSSLIWFILYFYIAKVTAGAPRKKALITILGMTLSAVGFTLDSERVLIMRLIPVWVAPILYIVGIMLLIYSQTLE
jgi:hypothetical protein